MDIEIAHCIFDASGADEGVIRFKNGSDVRIHDNEFFDCQYGIVVEEHLVGTISGNIFRNMSVGAACVCLLNGRDTGSMNETTYLTLTGNSIDSKIITKDNNYGILLAGALGKCHVTSLGNTWQNLKAVVADYTTTSPKVTFTSIGDIVGDNVDAFIDTNGTLAYTKYKISGLQGPLTALATKRSPSNAEFWDGQIATDVFDGKFTDYTHVRVLTVFKDRKTFKTNAVADLVILGNLAGNSYISCEVQLNVLMVASGKVYTAMITGIMNFFNGSVFNFTQTGVAGASQITGATLAPSGGKDANSFLITATITPSIVPESGYISFTLSKFHDPVEATSFSDALVATIKAAP